MLLRSSFFIPNYSESPFLASLPQVPAFVFFCLSLAFEDKLHFGDKHFLKHRVKSLSIRFSAKHSSYDFKRYLSFVFQPVVDS